MDTTLNLFKEMVKAMDNIKDTKFYKELKEAAVKIGVIDLDKKATKIKVKELEKESAKITLSVLKAVKAKDTEFNYEEANTKYEELAKAWAYLRLFIL